MTEPSGLTWRVQAGADETTAVWDPPIDGDSGAVFVCAHGAGGHMGDRSILSLSRALRAAGIGTVRFNFFYRASGSARPDTMPRLITCLEAVVAHVRSAIDTKILVLGGRSMGGRAASVAVSDGAACDGVLLLAYPLHPPAHPEKLRAEHLSRIRVPVLCLNGTRDSFCDRALMERVLSGLGKNWRMHWLEAADHGFHVLKSSGRSDAEVLDEAAAETRQWVSGLGATGGSL